MDTYDILEKIENYKEFQTVEELNESLSKLCLDNELISIGKSELNKEIFAAKIGNGKETALIFGFPHPNEPIGSLTCLSLIKLIKNNSLLINKYTWYIIPCADPDGAKLNEGWFKGEFTIKKYAYNFYRTQANKQTDWNFPIKYKDYTFDKPPKNTKALARLIERIKPSLIYPLHNAGFNGAYFFITRRLGNEYYEEIVNLCNNLKIPLDLGEPEMPFMQPIQKPIYPDFGLEEIYDYLKDNDQDPLKVLDNGTNSISYTLKNNPIAFGIIGEVPYIYDEQISDQSLVNETRHDLLRSEYEEDKKIVSFIDKIIKEKDINKKSLFYVLLKDVIQLRKSYISANLRNIDKAEFKDKAKKSEKFSSQVISKFYDSLIFGECRRLLLESNKTPQIINLVNDIENKINNLIDYVGQNSHYKIIPIRDLVKLQIGCLLISLKYLQEIK